jgi:hypothetical protein
MFEKANKLLELFMIENLLMLYKNQQQIYHISFLLSTK